MRTIRERLEQSVHNLETLEQKRLETKTPSLGLNAEWSIIERELQDLEQDILDDPGALGKFLIRIRRRS